MKYSIRAYYCEGDNYTSVPIKGQDTLKRIDGYAIYQDKNGEDMHVSDHKTFEKALSELVEMRERRMGMLNGFESWHETHFEIVTAITERLSGLQDNVDKCVVQATQYQQGRGGLFELAKDLTDEFEKKFHGWCWGVDEKDGELLEYFDEIDKFLNGKLKRK